MRKLRPRPQLGAVVVNGPDAQTATGGEAAEDRDAAADAQVDEERVGVDDAAGGEGGAARVVGREQRGRVLRVAEWEVHEDALQTKGEKGVLV